MPQPSLASPDMCYMTLLEQSVIAAPQVAVNYSESRDFVQKVSRRLSGLRVTPRTNPGLRAVKQWQFRGITGSARVPSPTKGDDDEAGRKRVLPRELSGVPCHNKSLTSCALPRNSPKRGRDYALQWCKCPRKWGTRAQLSPNFQWTR